MATKKILVIEDNEDDYIVISRLIKSEYQSIYNDGRGNINSLIKEVAPDCILLDYHLGNTSGIDILAIIEDEILSKIPVIMLTGEKNPDVVVSCMKSGAADYLCKGDFGKEEILDKINKAIETTKLHAIIKEQQNKLNESEERLSNFMNSATNGFTLWNQNLDLIEINNSQLLLFPSGTKKEEVMGKNILEIFPDTEESGRHKIFKNVLKTGIAINLESLIPNPKFGKRYWSLKAFKVGSGLGLIVNDVTLARKAEEDLKQHAIILQARNEELDAFSHTVAHDLRNPLGTIIGFSEMLMSEYGSQLEGDVKEYINKIMDMGCKMNQITDSLLLLSNVRKADVKANELNMENIISETLSRFTLLIEEKNAKIKFPGSWPVGLGYAPWVEEVWVNYLSNALKYGGDNVQIELGFDIDEQTVTNEKMVRFWVKDNGPGISVDDQERLFHNFERLEQIKIVGHGLGLSIVRRIVEKLNGQVGIESKIEGRDDEKGSLFYFTLPYHSEGDHKNVTRNEQTMNIRTKELSDLKILIVEDGETARLHLSIVLKQYAREILFANTGVAGVEMCLNNPDIDLVLMDIMLPEMDGYEATSKIREFNEDVVIITQTALSIAGDREKALASGCNDYITKPINRDDLLEKIRRNILRFGRNGQIGWFF